MLFRANHTFSAFDVRTRPMTDVHNLLSTMDAGIRLRAKLPAKNNTCKCEFRSSARLKLHNSFTADGSFFLP